MSHPTLWTEEDAQSAIREILRRADHDTEFRSLCLSNPRQAVQEATGRTLPPDFKLRVVPNNGANLTIVLPDSRVIAELSESELEAIAGGTKCLVGTCGASEVCGVTKPCFVASKIEGSGEKKEQKGT